MGNLTMITVCNQLCLVATQSTFYVTLLSSYTLHYLGDGSNYSMNVLEAAKNLLVYILV